MKIKTFNQIFLGGYGEKWFDQFGHVTQKFTVSQKLTDGINSIFYMLVQIRENFGGGGVHFTLWRFILHFLYIFRTD